MEVLEQGGTTRRDRPRLPAWAGRVAIAAALTATAVAALQSLPAGPSTPAAPARPAADPAPGSATSGGSPGGPQVPSYRPGDPSLGTSAVILLRTPGAVIVDVDTGHRAALSDSVDRSVDWSETGETVLLGANLGRTVVTVVGQGGPARADRQVLAVRPGGAVVRLGPGSRVLPATPDSVWLVRRGGARRTVALVGVDGVVRRSPRPLPQAVDVSGVAAGGRLVVGARWPDEPGPLLLWDPATGRVARLLARAAIVHSNDARQVVWSACAADCPLVVTRLADGSTRPLGLVSFGHGHGHGIAGRLRLSPDGRHYAVLVSRPDSVGLNLLIGHLPGSARAGTFTMPLRGLAGPLGQRPRLSYARSGWLFVSTGERVYAVGPGPHNAVALDSLPRHERMVAS